MTIAPLPSIARRRSFLGFVVCALALLTASPVLAASGGLGPQIDLKPHQTFTGRFVHQHPVDGFDAPLRSEGRFEVDGKNKIVWAIEKPMMTTTTITDDGLTQGVGGYTLLKISNDKMPFLAELQRDLLWALSGKWSKLEKDFTITQSGTSGAWTVTVTPKETGTATRKPFRQLIAKGSRYVEQAEIVLPSGVTDHLTFSGQAVGP